MKSWKLIGTLALALVVLASFTVFSTAQDKKQDNKTKKTTVKVEAKKIDKTKLNQSKCTRHAQKDKVSNCLKGKVLISKDHDCANCPEANAENATECEHEKTKCEHEKTKCEHEKAEKKTNKEKK
ncbi:MAG: hypothetical protein GXO74_02550 [Calditrichaeota bacterium]|nr:hypothetical protein [Calditrichota bacterium]